MEPFSSARISFFGSALSQRLSRLQEVTIIGNAISSTDGELRTMLR